MDNHFGSDRSFHWSTYRIENESFVATGFNGMQSVFFNATQVVDGDLDTVFRTKNESTQTADKWNVERERVEGVVCKNAYLFLCNSFFETQTAVKASSKRQSSRFLQFNGRHKSPANKRG